MCFEAEVFSVSTWLKDYSKQCSCIPCWPKSVYSKLVTVLRLRNLNNTLTVNTVMGTPIMVIKDTPINIARTAFMHPSYSAASYYKLMT